MNSLHCGQAMPGDYHCLSDQAVTYSARLQAFGPSCICIHPVSVFVEAQSYLDPGRLTSPGNWMLHSLIAEPGLVGSIDIVAKSTGSSLITFPEADLMRRA